MAFSHRIRNSPYSAIKYAINMLIFVRQDLQDSLDFFLSFQTKLRKTNPLAVERTSPLTIIIKRFVFCPEDR